MSEHEGRRALVVILALFLLFGVGYSVVNPIFESPDESLNYANIRFLVDERRLPVLKPDEPTKAHHPPAYYALGALLTGWVPNENFDAITERVNAFWIHRVDEPGVDNKNLYLHSPALERFPYQDVALGVHLVRWLSLLMGGGVILCVYSTTRELMPRQPSAAVTAAALVAFNPMFLFISGSVHDDALANLVAAATLYVTARVLTRGPTMRQAVALGVLLGIALLTKLTCLLIVPTVALALLSRLRGGDGRLRWPALFRIGGTSVLVALLIGGWWLARNQMVYGEPTSMGRQVEAWGGLRSHAPNVAAAARELGFLHDSFWGVFGYGQIPMSEWTYTLPRLLVLLSLGGWLLAAARQHRPWGGVQIGSEDALDLSMLLILLSAPLVTFLVVFTRMTFIDTANFGRYLFVSLGFMAPLFSLGLGHWADGRNSKRIPLAVSVGMVALSGFALTGVLRPAYARPQMLSRGEVASRVERSDLRFGDSIRLIGQTLHSNQASPGEEIDVTLCWESLAPMSEDYVYFVHVLGQEERIVGARSTHPGLGRYPTRRWAAGDRFCDVVDIGIDEGAPTPAVYDIEIGWHPYGSEERLPAYAPDGSPLELVLLDRVKVVPKRHPSIAVPARIGANLGDEITLLGYRADRLKVSPGDTLQITLFWEAQTAPAHDYTVFLHLAASNGPPHAQDDGQPREDAYPTSFWDEGEVVTETRAVSIPPDLSPGEYPLVAGMYLLANGERLPRLGSDGAVQGYTVPLATVTVRSGDS